jgi:hypothetical protein
MEKNINNPKKKSINESSIESIYTQLFGEYQPDEFSPKAESKTKESDIDEGKLFTKFIMKK